MRLPFGKRQTEQLASWAFSAATFGGVGGLTVLYFTDWAAVLRFVPFYGSKFEKKEE